MMNADEYKKIIAKMGMRIKVLEKQVEELVGELYGRKD